MSSPENPKRGMDVEATFQTKVHESVKKEEDPVQLLDLLLNRLEHGGESLSIRDLLMFAVSDIESEYTWRDHENPAGDPVETLPHQPGIYHVTDTVISRQAREQMLKLASSLEQYAQRVAPLEERATSEQVRESLRQDAWKRLDKAKQAYIKKRDKWYEDLLSV